MTHDDILAAVQDVTTRFTYRSDPEGGRRDEWVLPPRRGPIEGDCEEYAGGVFVAACGSRWKALAAILTGRARMHRVRFKTYHHAVGELEAGGVGWCFDSTAEGELGTMEDYRERRTWFEDWERMNRFGVLRRFLL